MQHFNDIPVIVDEFIVRHIANEVIIMSEDGNDIHVLDDIGAFIWKNIDGKRSISAILEQILNEYEVSEDLAGKDLTGFLQELSSKKIIRIETGLS